MYLVNIDVTIAMHLFYRKAVRADESFLIVDELKDKSRYVQWDNDARKEYYGIVERKIENKEKLRSKGFLVFNLEDF